jgi:hypothetical protein
MTLDTLFSEMTLDTLEIREMTLDTLEIHLLFSVHT